MTKSVSYKENNRLDPHYPYPTELNDEGEIVYSVPVLAEGDDALVTLNARENGGLRYISFGAGERKPVVFVKTTNREFAYDQRRWLNTEHTRDLRRSRREFFFEGCLKDEEGEEIPRDENPLLMDAEEGYARFENADLLDHIADYLDRRFPHNGLYREVFLLVAEELTPKVIAERLGVDAAMVYYYRREALRAAREYRQLYSQE